MRAELIESCVRKDRSAFSGIVKDYAEKLRTRIAEMTRRGTSGLGSDSAGAAVFADKINVTEVVRLGSHIRSAEGRSSETARSQKARNWIFLIQEMNREAHTTIGSKENDLEITNNVLEIKVKSKKSENRFRI